ncbi:MAG: cell division protein FtsZ, partial [Paucibacter sp.]|nr:cell division protein FtsZ [Roseateles sp.]
MTLTAMLAILGGLVLAGVIAHGAWTARKAGPRRADPQLEPQMSGHEPDMGEAKDAVSQDFQEDDAADPLKPSARPQARKPSNRVDALIDAIAVISVDAPVSGEMAISHLPGSRRAGSKPFHIEGLNAESGEWELPLKARRYSEFQAGVQMANRSGAMNEIEYSEFVQKVQAFSDGVGGFVQFPDMLEVVAHARELDQFAGDHDAQLAVLLRARNASWTLGFVQQMALRHG